MPKNDLISLENSNRAFDDNGYLHVKDCVLTAEEVSKYLGKEIQGYQKLGLDANTLYGIYRPAEEIKKAQATFHNLQLLDKHIPVNSKDPKREVTVGTIGTDSHIEDGKLKATVTIWTQKAIDEISKADQNPTEGKKDLSCGYTYDLVQEKGQFNGVPYDFKMVNIKGNHVALVPDGRVGAAMIADHQMAMDEAAKEIIKIATDADFEGKEDVQIAKIKEAVKALKTIQTKEESGMAEKEKDMMDSEAEAKEKECAKMSKDKSAKDEEEEKKEEKKAADEAITPLAMDEASIKKFAADAVREALDTNNKVLAKVTEMIGRITPQILMDSNPDAIADKALQLKGINATGKSLETKLAMMDAVIATTNANKPKKIAMDSKTNSSTGNYPRLTKGE